jgi:hypothetical protein
MNTRFHIVASAGLAVVASLLSPDFTQADPLPGQVLKFGQQPMDNVPVDGALFWGHDEASTAYGSHPAGLYGFPNAALPPSHFMADDFADKVSTPVVHVKWWGSYLGNQFGNRVQKFLISFETDNPAPPAPFSYPGSPLLNQVVTPGVLTPGSGTFTETSISLGGAPLNEELFQYNAELRLPFQQQADTVYWLKIVALVDPSVDGNIEWGWHNRDYTQQNLTASPAVTPGERIIGPFPSGSGAVWHFQDDAIQGTIANIDLNSTTGPNGIDFQQPLPTFIPQNYVDNSDGPPGISQYSKDLAFELYTVPEPAGLPVLCIGAYLLTRRRRSNAPQA